MLSLSQFDFHLNQMGLQCTVPMEDGFQIYLWICGFSMGLTTKLMHSCDKASCRMQNYSWEIEIAKITAM